MTQASRGTRDVLPAQSHRWQQIEARMRQAAAEAGYCEVRTPVLEHAELFRRGEDGKSMYTFRDGEDRSIALRPEGTAGVVRCFLEAGMYSDPLPCKMYYLSSPMFGSKDTRQGVLREYHRFGLECFGAKEASVEAEMILLAYRLLCGLGIRNLTVRINSVGCPVCRPKGSADEYMLCGECSNHLSQLQLFLNAADVPCQTDRHLGFDRSDCTATAFEVVVGTREGEQIVCSGARYDNLIEDLGGPKTPAAGMSMDVETMLMLLDSQGIELPEPRQLDVFVTYMGDHAADAFTLVQRLRNAGLKADMDHCARSHKAQFKFAQKTGAPLCITLGDAEVREGIAKIKNMKTRDEHTAKIDFADKACRSILKK